MPESLLKTEGGDVYSISKFNIYPDIMKEAIISTRSVVNKPAEVNILLHHKSVI